MLFSSALLPQELALLGCIVAAAGASVAFLRRRGRLGMLRRLWLPLASFTLFGLADALVTLHGTWQAPWREANPAMRALLLRAGWLGQCLGSALWVLAWALVLSWLEAWRERRPARAAQLGWLQLWLAYALALGHLNGFVSWAAPRGAIGGAFSAFYRAWSGAAGWLEPISPFGYPLYSGLCFGGVAALAHVLAARLAAAARR
ncbi:MAG TPA: hypothetical protein PKK15_20595 [Kouleothrix sp.]|uniref:hypothetical protein n=1 Tax=Kouleothrix sp. TaxID=2779161 RepID=UPI002BA1A006|nr:hypothetical protein [Kouleothrix sp.]